MIDLRALNFTSERNVVDPIAKQLESKLSPCGALNLFGLLMRITPTYEACVLMGAALRSHSVGQPSTAFFNYVEEAKFWVSLAGIPEKKCYLATIYQSLSEEHKRAFWDFTRAGSVT